MSNRKCACNETEHYCECRNETEASQAYAFVYRAVKLHDCAARLYLGCKWHSRATWKMVRLQVFVTCLQQSCTDLAQTWISDSNMWILEKFVCSHLVFIGLCNWDNCPLCRWGETLLFLLPACRAHCSLCGALGAGCKQTYGSYRDSRWAVGCYLLVEKSNSYQRHTFTK